MKKLALPLAALAIALSVYGLTAGPAQAQARGTWEYRVFSLDPTEYQDKADYKSILDKEGPRKSDSAFKEHVLNYLGKQGWELVDMEIRQQNLIYYYLKRRAG